MKEDSLEKQISELHDINIDDIDVVKTHVENIIASVIFSNLHDNENETSIDIGLGKLVIRVFTDFISYQFEPSECLQEKIREVIIDNKNPLIDEIQKKIDKKLLQLYKELLK